MRRDNTYGWWVAGGSIALILLGLTLLYFGITYGLFPLVIGGYITRTFSIDDNK